MSKTAVVGVGNILMGDEGIGVRAIQALEKVPLPADVTLFDGGTAFPALTAELDGFDKLIIVDAVNGGASPGTIYRLSLEEILQARALEDAPNTASGPISVHDIGVIEALIIERLYAKTVLASRPPKPSTMLVVGMEPEQIALSMELSPAIEAKLPKLIETVLDELEHSVCAYEEESS